MTQHKATNNPALPGVQTDLVERLYEQHRDDLCKNLQKTFGSGPPEPEDVVQSAFARFFALENPERIESPRGFLWRTAYNIVLDYKRHAAIAQRHQQGLQADGYAFSVDELTAEHVLSSRQQVEIIRRVLDDLPARQRELVILNRVKNIPYAEVARQTGIPVTTVKRMVASALVLLDEALEEAEAIYEAGTPGHIGEKKS